MRSATPKEISKLKARKLRLGTKFRRTHGGNVNDLSFDTTHTATTRVLRLFSASAGSVGLGIGEKGLIATAICTAFDPCGESSRIIL
jgi:hypothetical protein